VPQLRTHHKTIEVRPGQNTEVTESNIAASENPVQKRVATVHQAKRHTLQAPTALRKHGGRMISLPHRVEEHGDVLRSVFSVCIHYHDCVSRPVLLDVRKRNCNGSLMAQVTPQPEHRYTVDRFWLKREPALICGQRGTIVNVKKACAQGALFAQYYVDVAAQFHGRVPIFVHRHDD